MQLNQSQNISPSSSPRRLRYRRPTLEQSDLEIDTDTHIRIGENEYESEFEEPEEPFFSPAQSLDNTSSSSSNDLDGICVVCMDRPRDVILKPCNHTACCAACFMRLESRKCPVCRTQAETAHFIGKHKSFAKKRFCQSKQMTSEINDPPEDETLDINTSHEYHYFHLPPQSSRYHGGSSVMSVAHQSSSSQRDVLAQQLRAFRSIQSAPNISNNVSLDPIPISTTPREVSDFLHAPESVGISPRLSDATQFESSNNFAMNAIRQILPAISSHIPRETFVSTTSPRPSEAHPPLSTTIAPRTVLLLGSSVALMEALIRKLQILFRPPLWESQTIYKRDPALLYIHNEPMRLHPLERKSDSVNETVFQSEIDRFRPSMILLCADFFNLPSFEAIVRLDLEFFDTLNIACFWVIIKQDRGRQARLKERGNRVETSDVTNAQYYIGKPRRWFVANIDKIIASDVRKLGWEIHGATWHEVGIPLQTPTARPGRVSRGRTKKLRRQFSNLWRRKRTRNESARR